MEGKGKHYTYYTLSIVLEAVFLIQHVPDIALHAVI